MDNFLLDVFKNPDEVKLWRNSLTAGGFEVEGFVAHDKKDYNGAKESFHSSLNRLLPWLPSDDLLKIAEEKTEVLRHHDYIEESGKTRSEKLRDHRWDTKVLPHAKKEARLMGIDLGYAREKVDFYRLHGQGEIKFRHHVYDMDKHFTSGLTGDPHLYMVTAPIYLTCVGLHDRRRMLKQEDHNDMSMKMMQIMYADYVTLVHMAFPNYREKVLSKVK